MGDDLVMSFLSSEKIMVCCVYYYRIDEEVIMGFQQGVVKRPSLG